MHIVGVSFDSPAGNKRFAESEGFQYELWTDSDKTLADTYGANAGSYARRVTKILAPDGSLILEYLGFNDVAVHPRQVLDDCERLFGE